MTALPSNRYRIVHPLLTPEKYCRFPLDFQDHVRGLHIPQDHHQSPDVILDTADTIIDYVFNGMPTRCLHFWSGFHMYIPNNQGVAFLGENIIATQLMRQHYLTELGVVLPDTIYGDVCVFGTESTNDDYSVPYEIVEQLIHLYEHNKF